MNELQTFTYNQTQVRTIDKAGEPWFVLADVCRVLEIRNPSQLGQRLDEDERAMFNIGRQGSTWCINESGLYNVILRSDKPQAKPFRKWVTAEVLPSIRKTGQYAAAVAPKANKALEIKEMNAKVRLSNQFLKLSKVETLSTEYKNILAAKAAEVLTGTQFIPLPKSAQKMYSATEIGQMFGVSAQKIGRLSNEYNLKTPEYGAWYRSKSEHSNKEVDTFVYNNKAIERFRAIIV